MNRAIDERVFPGCVLGVVTDTGERLIIAGGRQTYEKDSPPVTAETVYDLASITKSIPTASLLLQYIAEGKLKLTDAVSSHIRELQNHRGATIEDLMRYRVKGPPLSQLHFKTFEEMRTFIFEQGLEREEIPIAFTNYAAFLMGVVVERVGSAGLAVLAHKEFFEPLNMTHTTFFPAASDCAPTEIDAQGNVIQGIVHDESARLFAKARRTVGHAGLFSTAPDMSNFLTAILDNRFPAILKGAQKGLGWETDDGPLRPIMSKGTFGKTGFTGTSVLVDPEKGRALVILSNRTFPKRPHDRSAINTFRKHIADIVFG